MQQCLRSMTHTERENKMLTMKFFDSITTKEYTGNNWLSTVFSNIVTSYNRYRIYKQTVKELNAMSDRDLHDIGLSRYEIEDLAYESAYGEKK